MNISIRSLFRRKTAPRDTRILLQAQGLTKQFKRRVVIDKVNLIVHRRQIVGLLGRNGAGKTTLFKMIVGMITPDAGAIVFQGMDVTAWPMYRRARAGMAYLPQERTDFRTLTVWENLQVVLELFNMPRRNRIARAEELLAQFELCHVRNQRAERLSGGERRRMEIARALTGDPQLLLLDEPFSGVDPLAAEELRREVLRLRDQFSKAVLLTDHDVDQTLRVCDRATIVHEGHVLAEGDPWQIASHPDVRSAYLGESWRPRATNQTNPPAARSIFPPHRA